MDEIFRAMLILLPVNSSNASPQSSAPPVDTEPGLMAILAVLEQSVRRGK